MHSGLFSGGSTIRSAIDPLDIVKKVDSISSQSFVQSSQKSSPQFSTGIRLPVMRVQGSSTTHSAKPPLPPQSTTTVAPISSSKFEDERPLPITSSKASPSTTKNSSSSALDSLLFGGENGSKRAAHKDDAAASNRHRSAPEIIVDHPTPFQSSAANSRASSEIIPSAKSTPTIQVGTGGTNGKNPSPAANRWEINTQHQPSHHQQGGGTHGSNSVSDPSVQAGRGGDWDLMRGATRTEASCLLDKLYFKPSVQHFLDFGDTVGNTDKNGNVLVESDVRAALLSTHSAQKTDTSLHALQSRLLHQLHLIDIPDLEKARVASTNTNSNNFIVRSILNSRQAQNTELLPVKVAMPSTNTNSNDDDEEEDKYQVFSCGFCGLGEHGDAPALLLLDARYHGPGERIDHCPSCGMYQGA